MFSHEKYAQGVFLLAGELEGNQNDNAVESTKYNLINWLPKSLFEQFRRLANIYFLFISILMLIGTYAPSFFQSPLEPWSTLVTLFIVLLITSVKEGIDDLGRHRDDQRENNRSIGKLFSEQGKETDTFVLQEHTVACETLTRGDLVVVRDGETMPADLILLASSQHGECYVETSNIDGETNLKFKAAPPSLVTSLPLVSLLSSQEEEEQKQREKGEEEEERMTMKFRSENVLLKETELQVELPNPKIHNFSGSIVCKAFSDEEERKGEETSISLAETSFLLRGSRVQNVDWIVGIVAYVGDSTKIAQNAREAPSKLSTFERYVNGAVKIIFLAQLILVSIVVIASESTSYKLPYITDYDDDDGGSMLPSWLESFLVFFLLFNNFIPISLYVTLEIVNLGQTVIMNKEPGLVMRSSNLCQEPGLISHIFSDKTGTLTKNEMIFRICADPVSKTVSYVVPKRERTRSRPSILTDRKSLTESMKRLQGIEEGNDAIDESKKQQGENGDHDDANDDEEESFNQLNPSFQDYERPTSSSITGHSDTTRELFFSLLVCHSIVRAPGDPMRGESPDELALVKGLESLLNVTMNREIVGGLGSDVESRVSLTKKSDIIEQGKNNGNSNKDHFYSEFGFIAEQFGSSFDVVAMNDFSSSRKRMSVLIRDPMDILKAEEEGREVGYLLLVKGADSSLLPLLRSREAMSEMELEELAFAEEATDKFGVEGLRTLWVAKRHLSPREGSKWLERYREARLSVDDRSKKLRGVAAEIEQQLQLVGATGIEDLLQDNVEAVLIALGEAKVKVWMLTGDKRETAINIGYSCGLIPPEAEVIRIADDLSNLEEILEQMEKKHTGIIGQDEGGNGHKPVCCVITGVAVTALVHEKEEWIPTFIDVCNRCYSLIGCRLSPSNKTRLVSIMKREDDPMQRSIAMAIGDGANDVGMIQEADIGVGISGKEGRQAVNASDVAIETFDLLLPLVFRYGRTNYTRQSTVFAYSMHKNIVMTFTLFWYSFYTAISGTSPYESLVYTLFNFALGLPVIFFGIWDQDLPASYLLSTPSVFWEGRFNLRLDIPSIGGWIVNAMLYSAVICTLFYTIGYQTFAVYSLYTMGQTVYVGMVNSLHLKMLFFSNSLNWIVFFGFFISILGMYIVLYTYNLSEYYLGVSDFVYSESYFWLFASISLPIIVVVFVDVLYYSISSFILPMRMLSIMLERWYYAILQTCYPRKQRVFAVIDNGNEEVKEEEVTSSVDLPSIQSHPLFDLYTHLIVGNDRIASHESTSIFSSLSTNHQGYVEQRSDRDK